MKHLLSLIVLVSSFPLVSTLAAEPAKDQATLEKEFAEKLSGATLVGRYTDRTKPDAPLKEDRYTIAKVSKVKDDIWLFETRIQYGGHDATLPLPLRVVWAGDTPVLTLDSVGVPGFGTFTCRILFYGNEYAGTWDGANHGGTMFGRIERAEKKE